MIRPRRKFPWVTVEEAVTAAMMALACFLVFVVIALIPACVERYIESVQTEAPSIPKRR